MAQPRIITNTVTPPTISAGQSAVWRTVAENPADRSCCGRRSGIPDFQVAALITDTLVYGAPTSDDPSVILTVDSLDPTIVHVTV